MMRSHYGRSTNGRNGSSAVLRRPPVKGSCNKPRFDAMIVRVHVPRAQGRDFSHKLIQKPMADKPYAASVDSPEGGQQWMLIGSLTRRGTTQTLLRNDRTPGAGRRSIAGSRRGATIP